MQTTWDDPAGGPPRIVPSKLVKQAVAATGRRGSDVPKQHVEALPKIHSRIGDLNKIQLKALRKLCTARQLVPKGRRTDLVLRLIGDDLSNPSLHWQVAGHSSVGQKLARPGAQWAAEPLTAEVTAWKPASGAGEAVRFHVVFEDGEEEVLEDEDISSGVQAYQEIQRSKPKRKDSRVGERARLREGQSVTLGKWSEDEIDSLDQALAEAATSGNSDLDWKAIATAIGTRSHLQAKDYYRRRMEIEKKLDANGAGKDSLQEVVQRYMTDHGLSQLDKLSLGITASALPNSLMTWLSGTYGGEQAPSLAARLRAFLSSPGSSDAKVQDKTPDEDADVGADSAEDTGDPSLPTAKRSRAKGGKGPTWTAAEERLLRQLIAGDAGTSKSTSWQDKADTLGTKRSGNSVHQRWKLIQLGGGEFEGEGKVTRRIIDGAPKFEPDEAETNSSSDHEEESSASGDQTLTTLANITCYRIASEEAGEYEIRVTDNQPPRCSVDDMVKLICNLNRKDTKVSADKDLLLQTVQGIGRSASIRKRSHSWLSAQWSSLDGILAYCAAFREAAHAEDAANFRSTSAFETAQSLFAVLAEVGPAHPTARGLECESSFRSAGPHAESARGAQFAAGHASPTPLPDVAEFRPDLDRMCDDSTLEGRRLSVYWGGDQSWYNGRVVQCRPGKFKIVYDDGEMSWESCSMQIGIKFLEPPAAQRSEGAAASAAKKEAEIEEWKVLTFINSEPYEPSDLRLTGEKPARIALHDFLECVLDVEGSETKKNQVVKMLKRSLKKNAILEYVFVDEKGKEDRTHVVSMIELGNIFPLLPNNYTNRVRETGDLHRLQKMLRQETGVAEIEMFAGTQGAAELMVSGAQAAAAGAGKMANVSLEDWDEMWSPVLCYPSNDTKGKIAAAAQASDPYVNPSPASHRLESRQLMTQGGTESLPRATSRHPGHTRLPSAPTAELRWLCTTGNLVGRRVSVYWPKDDLWYDGKVDQCQPGRFKLTYDSGSGDDSTEPPVMRWEVLGIGVHLLTRLPVGETMRKMFATRSRLVNGRGRPVEAPPLQRERQSSPVPVPLASLGAADAALDPAALAVLMAPAFRVAGGESDLLPTRGNGSAAASKSSAARGKARALAAQPVESDSDSDSEEDAAADKAPTAERADWTPKEEAYLRQVSISLGPGRWEDKAKAMNSNRTSMSLSVRYGKMMRRAKGDPELRRGFQMFNTVPSTREVNAARSATGLSAPPPQGQRSSDPAPPKQKKTKKRVAGSCESCGQVLPELKFGAGRFCDMSCKNRFGAAKGHEGRANSKRQRVQEGDDDDDESSSSDDGSSDDDDGDGSSEGDLQCQQCGIAMDGNFGSGRFCDNSCRARWSRRGDTVAEPRSRKKGARLSHVVGFGDARFVSNLLTCLRCVFCALWCRGERREAQPGRARCGGGRARGRRRRRPPEASARGTGGLRGRPSLIQRWHWKDECGTTHNLALDPAVYGRPVLVHRTMQTNCVGKNRAFSIEQRRGRPCVAVCHHRA